VIEKSNRFSEQIFRTAMSEVSLAKAFTDLQRDYVRASALEDERGSSDGQVHALMAALATQAERVATLVRQAAVHSANEQLDDVNTHDVRLVLAHFYAGATRIRLACPERSKRVANLKQARVHLSVFVALCHRWHLLSDTDVAALERYRPRAPLSAADAAAAADAPSGGGDLFASASAKREYKIERFKREKETRVLLKAMLDKRAARRADVDAENGGFDDEDEWRKFELLQVRSAILESFALLESAVDELGMLEEIERRQQQAGGEDRLRAEMQRERAESARNAPPPQAPITIMPGQLSGAAPAPPSAIERRLDQRQQIARDVFKQPHIVATYTPEEAAEMDMAAGRYLSGGGNDPSKDADDKDEDADADDDDKVRKAREWDDWKDDNPKGAGNRSRKG
jgi:immunoglobulin-binding protein 1